MPQAAAHQAVIPSARPTITAHLNLLPSSRSFEAAVSWVRHVLAGRASRVPAGIWSRGPHASSRAGFGVPPKPRPMPKP